MYGKKLAICLAIPTLLATALMSAPATKPEGGKLVYEFRGTGEAETKEFVIRDDWGLDWEVRGNIYWIGVKDQTKKEGREEDSNTVMHWETSGRKSGFVTHDKGGRYKLKTFYAKGPWRIRVYQFSGRIE